MTNTTPVRQHEHLFAWMEERELIRQRRNAGEPWPWTQDPILQRYRFANVMREFDRISMWVADNVVDKFKDDPDLPARVAIARHINKPSTLALLPDELDIDTYVEVLNNAPRPLWGSAYMIRAQLGKQIYPSKHEDVLRTVVAPMLGVNWNTESLQAMSEQLMAFHRIGGFMAYEIVSDLRWSPNWLMAAPDIMTWTNIGPGAGRGLRRLGMPAKVEPVRQLLKMANERDWNVIFPRRFEMRDIEHSLCEWDKMARAQEGKYHGRPYGPGFIEEWKK